MEPRPGTKRAAWKARRPQTATGRDLGPKTIPKSTEHLSGVKSKRRQSDQRPSRSKVKTELADTGEMEDNLSRSGTQMRPTLPALIQPRSGRLWHVARNSAEQIVCN